MKTKLFIIGFAALLFAGCGRTVIESGDLTLTIDGNMHFKVESSAPGALEYFGEYQAADVLVADEAVIEDWKVKKVTKSSDETGTTYTLVGEWKQNGYDIEKILTVKAVNGFEGMLLTNSSYVNHSDKILTVKAMESNKLSVASDETVWSFQPTSTAHREDWILPVDESFYQKNYLGMNNTDYGGGIPMVTLWRRDANLSVGLVEPNLKLVSMPVKKVRYEDYVTMSLLQIFRNIW